jgi:coronatine-insensitive protein 1
MSDVAEDRNVNRTSTGISDVVLGYVMQYIHDPKDRDAVSLVCRKWYELEARTRKHVTIALCYSTSPDRLRCRFGNLESLKLKGKPRAAMFNLIPEDWGGYATPWVREIAESFNFLDSLQFRRMIVKDSDLELLTRSRGRVLLTLKLDKCSGFTTDGLLHIGRSCRYFFFLYLKIVCDNSKFIALFFFFFLCFSFVFRIMLLNWLINNYVTNCD